MKNVNPRLRSMVTAAIFAAAITVVTAYFLHIPLPTGGYVHLGDALIYLAAGLLPAPYACFAASVGAGLADLLTAPEWFFPTFLIKSVVALQFTSKKAKLLCPRNIIAVFTTAILSPVLYSVAFCIMTGTWTLATFVAQFWGTIGQAIMSGILFFILAYTFDKMNLKTRILGMQAAA